MAVTRLAGMTAAVECREATARCTRRRTSAATWVESINAAAHWRVRIGIINHCDFASSRNARDVVYIKCWEAGMTCN